MHNASALNRLIAANAISGFAQGISMIAIPVWFINVLGIKEVYNQLFLYVTLAVLIWGPYAGTLVDRYNRKWLFFVLNIVGTVVLLTASVQGFMDGLTNNFLVSTVFVFTILNYNLHYPALYAFTHELISEKDYGNVSSRIEIQSQVTSMLAGVAAAMVLSGITYNGVVYLRPWPLHYVFLVDGLTYVISAFIIFTITYTPVKKDAVDMSGLLERMKNGANFLLQHKTIFVFGVCSYIVFATLIVFGFYVMQVYTDEKLLSGVGTVAIGELFYTGGAIFAGFTTTGLLKYMHKSTLIMVYMGVAILLLALLIVLPNHFIYFLSSFLYGLTNAGIRIARTTWLFQRVPNRMMGRSGSIFNNFNILFRLIFIWLAGLGIIDRDVNNILYVLIGSIAAGMVPLLIWRKKFIG
ncbi:MAG TPA: MFS transporter [Flavobacteriales bacterium]|nr:MFS transporter [Flavobacteriales bacterium]